MSLLQVYYVLCYRSDVSGESGLEKIFYTLLKIHDEIEKGDDTGSLRDLVLHLIIVFSSEKYFYVCPRN